MLPVLAPPGFVRRFLPPVGFLAGVVVAALTVGLCLGALREALKLARYAVGRESDADLL
jgi:hypothetical protein